MVSAKKGAVNRLGYLLQPLPFSVEVKDFRIEHYSSGQPKSFQSDLVIHDPEAGEPLEATIAVNHPLIYKGYAIYQASFSDGGSRRELRLWPLLPSDGKPEDVSITATKRVAHGSRNPRLRRRGYKFHGEPVADVRRQGV